MHTEDNGTETHLDKVEARAGSRNKVNRNALVWGLLLVVVALAVVLGGGFLSTNRSGADQTSANNVAMNESAR
ncbi:hypothetical protein WG907_02835 [Sphingobium sp. AN558]|uniref:hypothetical protein n=1 Tax=Sphingobium sp. AN558 TaxID=3133442 RepID=UPI0030C1F4C8